MDRAALKAAYARHLTANLWTGTGKYTSYKNSNPGEQKLIDDWIAALVASTPGAKLPPAPTLTTDFGRTYVESLSALLVPDTVPQPPAPTGTNPVPPPVSGCGFGAYVDVGTMGVTTDTQAWDKFEADAGKKVWAMMFGYPNFFTGGTFDPDGRLPFCLSRGAIPLLDIDTSQDGMGGHTQTTANYNAGKYDAYIDKAAQGCATFGHPMLVRIDAEMNGGWYAYGAEIRASSGGAQAFITMWQRIVTRFRAAGANNVAFHWCPNIDPDHYQPTTIEAVWPGDAYVDWAGFTGYNQGNMSVSYDFDDAYARVTALTAKPIMIGETGSVSATTTPTKEQWIAAFAAWLPLHPQVKSFFWFNWNVPGEGDWAIETSTASLAAFKQLTASSYIVGRA